MSKVLAVFGATGQQGSSIINILLADAELSRRYQVRAITRDVQSEKAKQLKEKVEVAQGDVLDSASLTTALAGVHTVFAMTTPSFGRDGLEVEYNSGKRIADVAVEAGVEYIIFSTLPSAKKISGGKFTKLSHFEAKAQVEQYIRSLPIKSAFFSPGFFMQNFSAIPFLAPQKNADGTWVMARHNSPTAKMPMIDIEADAGKFIGAILANPDRYEGKTFFAATESYNMDEVATAMSKATDKSVVYEQITLEEFQDRLPFGKDIFPETFSFGEEYGYYGPESEKLVAWTADQARGRLSAFEDYLKAHPLQLA